MQIFAATVMAALSLAVPHHHQDGRFQHMAQGCAKHFTVPMAEKAIDSTYDSDRIVTQTRRSQVANVIRCQWSTLHRATLNQQRAQAARAHFQRMHPPFESAFVSYYDDAGTHCCGYYATYGVADCGSDGVCYPQGTQIEFCDERCVIATVDDHGPYVYGRAFDLNENTAAAIGFPGLGYVRYRVMP